MSQTLPEPPVVQGLPLVGSALDLSRTPIELFTDATQRYGSVFRLRMPLFNVTVLTGEEGPRLMKTRGALTRGKIYDAFKDQLGIDVFGAEGDAYTQVRKRFALACSRYLVGQFLPLIGPRIVERVRELPPGQFRLFPHARRSLALAGLQMLTPIDLSHLADDAILVSDETNAVTFLLRPSVVFRRPAFVRARNRLLGGLREAAERHRAGEFADDRILYGIDSLAGGDLKLDLDQVAGAAAYIIGGMQGYVGPLVGFGMYEALRDPSLLGQLRAEADAWVASGFQASLVSRMKNTQAVTLEVLRKYPLVPFLGFRAARDLEAGGFRIPEGEMVLVTRLAHHFLAPTYRRPHVFDAERCMAPRNEHKCPGAYTPFGIAPRVCIAMGMTELAAAVGLASYLHGADFGLIRPTYQITTRPSPILTAQDGLPIVVKRVRSGDECAPTIDLLSNEPVADFGQNGTSRLPKATPVTFTAAQNVYVAGDAADAYYLLLDGEVEVRTGDKVEQIEAGEAFGDSGLLKGVPRISTVTAVVDSRCLRLDAEGFRQLLAATDLYGSGLGRALYLEYMRKVINEVLPRLDVRTAATFESVCLFERFEPGQTILIEGDTGTAFYVLIAGECEVSQGGRWIRTMTAPTVFGETAVLQKRPRTATVAASERGPVEVVRMKGMDFAHLLKASRGLRQDLVRLMSERFLSQVNTAEFETAVLRAELLQRGLDTD